MISEWPSHRSKTNKPQVSRSPFSLCSQSSPNYSVQANLPIEIKALGEGEMACTPANAFAFSSPSLLKSRHKSQRRRMRSLDLFTVKANSDDSDCNEEECAPDKEVGKASMGWLADEKTRVAGTYPPRAKRGWTGYVEKDTAGQTNIYSVEPAVYVAESAISSGNAGSSADGAQNTAAIAAGLALISVAAASSILLQVGKNSPQVQTLEYNGPALSYYINKFKPPEVIQAAVPSNIEPQSSTMPETSVPEVLQVQVQSQIQEPPPKDPEMVS